MLLYVDNDNCISLEGLTDKLNGGFIDDATVEVTLRDRTDTTEIAGETWPLSMPYIVDSAGVYTAVIESAVNLVAGETVIATVIVTTPGGGNAEFTDNIKVRKRNFVE